MTKSLILLLGLVLAAQCADVRIFGSTKMFVKDGIYTLFMSIDHKKEFYSYLIAYLWTLDDVTVITDGDGISFFVIGDWGGLPTFPYRYEINYMFIILDLCLINRVVLEPLLSSWPRSLWMSFLKPIIPNFNSLSVIISTFQASKMLMIDDSKLVDYYYLVF